MSHNGTSNIYLKAFHIAQVTQTHTHTNSSIFHRFLPPAKFIADDFLICVFVVVVIA